jgi:hypothetical protein
MVPGPEARKVDADGVRRALHAHDAGVDVDGDALGVDPNAAGFDEPRIARSR